MHLTGIQTSRLYASVELQILPASRIGLTCCPHPLATTIDMHLLDAVHQLVSCHARHSKAVALLQVDGTGQGLLPQTSGVFSSGLPPSEPAQMAMTGPAPVLGLEQPTSPVRALQADLSGQWPAEATNSNLHAAQVRSDGLRVPAGSAAGPDMCACQTVSAQLTLLLPAEYILTFRAVAMTCRWHRHAMAVSGHPAACTVSESRLMNYSIACCRATRLS